MATHNGFAGAERLLRSNEFDLAIIAFWEPASQLLPLLRTHSPRTRASSSTRWTSTSCATLGERSGGARRSTTASPATAAKELNTYDAADGVIAVSDKERDLLADFLGPGRVFTVPLAEHVDASTVPLDDRRGMYFVGNFRHLPNREAVEYLCNDVLPLLDPALLDAPPADGARQLARPGRARHPRARRRGGADRLGPLRAAVRRPGRGSPSCPCCTARA